jgi:hypothetical protein
MAFGCDAVGVQAPPASLVYGLTDWEKKLAYRLGWRYVQPIKGNFGCLSLVCAFSART